MTSCGSWTRDAGRNGGSAGKAGALQHGCGRGRTARSEPGGGSFALTRKRAVRRKSCAGTRWIRRQSPAFSCKARTAGSAGRLRRNHEAARSRSGSPERKVLTLAILPAPAGNAGDGDGTGFLIMSGTELYRGDRLQRGTGRKHAGFRARRSWRGDAPDLFCFVKVGGLR